MGGVILCFNKDNELQKIQRESEQKQVKNDNCLVCSFVLEGFFFFSQKMFLVAVCILP